MTWSHPVLDPKELERAVDMQRRSYKLLKWIGAAVEKGLIRFEKAHRFATFPEAAKQWILGHYVNIPADARPARGDIDAFCEFFKTYLENSFELVEKPGQILYSPDAHCFCPHCSWMVNAPHLKTRKLTRADKQRAGKMKNNIVRRIAAQMRRSISDEQCARIVGKDFSGIDAALLAYAYDLIERIKGVSSGPAILALWRNFAWTRKGSRKRDFELTSEMILAAEAQVMLAIRLAEESSEA